jgi:hypothetical protein
LDQIRDITDGADIEALELESYFNDQGSWLPVVTAKSVSEGLEMLDEKIKELEDNEDWKRSVADVFERITEVNDGSYGLSIAVNEKKENIFYKPAGLTHRQFLKKRYFVLNEEVQKVETAAYKDRHGIIENLVIEGKAVKEPDVESAQGEYAINQFFLKYVNDTKYTEITLYGWKLE